MTLHQLNGRLHKLEQQAFASVDYVLVPAAERQARIRALLLKHGVAPAEVDTTRIRLCGMSAAERQAWLKETSS